MSGYRIKVTPEQLRSIAIKINNCNNLANILTINSTEAFGLIQNNVLNSSIGNMNDKMTFLKSRMKMLSENIDANYQLLSYVADNFEMVDKNLANGNVDEIIQQIRDNQNRKGGFDVWQNNVSDTELAFLSGVTSGAATKDNPEEEFYNMLSSLPKNDPLRNIKPENIKYYKSEYETGFSAFVITDEFGNATVVFAGTNGDLGDIIADANLALGGYPIQRIEANKLINTLSKEYSNITVTGHSLGGYLATSVTMENASVSRCVAFDPPGQYGITMRAVEKSANVFGDSIDFPNEDKITTYITEGLVNKVGAHVGEIHNINIPWQPTNDKGEFAMDRAIGHNIDDIYNVLGGQEAVENHWANI